MDPDWVSNIEDLSMDDDEDVVFIDFPNGDRSDRFDCEAVIHLTEDPNTAATTGDYVMTLTGNPSSIRIPRNSSVVFSSPPESPDFYSIRELIGGTGEAHLGMIPDLFPNYRPMFMETPHLNSVLPFVCQSRCFLRNWLAIQHRLHRRFFARFLSLRGHHVPFSADIVRRMLVEMTGFFAFATIPFKTEGLSDKDKIGHAACLLRANPATLELVWQFYKEPLSEDIRVALGMPYPGEGPRDPKVNGFTEIVKDEFLGHILEPNMDFVEPGDVTVCFDAQNLVHAREVSRYWQVKFKDQLYQKLQTLGPWTPGSCGNGTMELDVVLPGIYGTEPKYDLPRIRECEADDDVSPVPIDTWKAIASTIDNHLLGCTAALFGAFTLDEPGAP